MPEPKSKANIIQRLETERRRLENNLASVPPEDMLVPGVVGEWSVKDVLAHLADWEAHMPVWVEAARKGDPVKHIDPGLTWSQIDEFNERIYQKHRNKSLDATLAYFQSEHEKFMQMVFDMPEDEMLAPRRYPFLGKGTIHLWLGLYAAHDAWAKKKIRLWLKSR